MTVDYGLALDVLVAVLLAVTIVYAAMLNRRLGRLREGRAELEAMVKHFNDAASRAEASIRGLKAAANQAAENLRRPVEDAERLHEELGLLVKRADVLAEQLSDGVSRSRRDAAIPTAAPSSRATRAAEAPPRAEIDETDDDARSRAERELLKALKGMR